MSKTLVVYFSKSGHTKTVAETIAREISSPLHEITTAKIRELCPGANVHDGIKANTIDGTRIREWLK